MDYNALIGDVGVVGSVKYWINYSRVDSAAIVDEAQKWIYSKLRVKEMTAAADVAIALSDTSVAYPTGYLDPIHFCIPGYVARIRLRDIESFRSDLGWDSSAVLPVAPPTKYCDFGGVLQLNTKSDAAYTAKMVYFRRPTALAADNTTNFLTDRYPTLFRRVCIMFASEERKEREARQELEILCLAQIDEIKKEGDLAFRGMEMDFNWSGTDDDL